MMIKRGCYPKSSCLVLLLILFVCACGPSQAELDATATQAAKDQHGTQTAQAPTATPTHTNTPTPTNTATPTATQTPTASPTSTPTPLPGMVISDLENGWRLYESNADGFAIALPPEWLHIDLNPEAFSDALAISGEVNPDLDALFTSETLRNLVISGIKFYALDPSIEAINLGLPTSINILSIDLGIELPLDTLMAINLQEIANLADPDYPLIAERTKISNLEAEEITYSAEMMGLGGTMVPILFKQFVMIDGSVQYIITFGAPLELEGKYLEIFDEIGKSFKLLD